MMNKANIISTLKELFLKSSTVEFEKQVDSIISQEENNITNKTDLYLKLLSFLDLTTLNDDDYLQSLKKIVPETITYYKGNKITVAGLCTFSNLLPIVNNLDLDNSIRKVVVSGGFPTGQISLEAKLRDISFAIENKADEIDVPINRGLFYENPNELSSEINKMKDTIAKTSNAKLKVIIETGALKNYLDVYKVSQLAIKSGADFIKTSTGKISRGADLYSSIIMLIAIKEHFDLTSKKIGFKAAGGIRKADDALKYYLLARFVLGEEYLTKDTFRIGCSNLKRDIINKL
ncbi:MAG: deoxyribose-phosphate aldolase [Bacteroidales bacterium]|nr:deoxyribose-phosphate aldolase [Bacteroidales bacterium]